MVHFLRDLKFDNDKNDVIIIIFSSIWLKLDQEKNIVTDRILLELFLNVKSGDRSHVTASSHPITRSRDFCRRRNPKVYGR